MNAARRPQNMLQLAEGVLVVARGEAKEGYSKRDPLKVRQAAEKAWLAVNMATDHAMGKHDRTPAPGPDAHQSRHEFLEAMGRRDLSKELSFFADRMHGDCFYKGACPTQDGMELALDEAAQFLKRIKVEL